MATSIAGGSAGTPFDWSPSGGASFGAQAQTFAARMAAEAQKDASIRQQAGETERARIAAEAAKFPELQKQRRFEQIFGVLGGGGRGGGVPGAGGMNFLNVPGAGLAAPPSIPGSLFGSPPGLGGGGGFFGGGGPGGGQQPGGLTDTTLPEFSENPFSRSQQGRAINAARASSQRQLGTEMRNISESGAGRGFAAGSPQTLARQDLARQRSMAGSDADRRGIQDRYAAGRSSIEQQRQALIAQRRTDIGKEDVSRRTAHFGPQSQLYSALLGAI